MRSEIDALRDCSSRVKISFFAQFGTLLIKHWRTWTFLAFDFYCWQNVLIVTILARLWPVWCTFGRVLVMFWRHEVVDFIWVVLLSSNLAWGEVSLSFSARINVAVIIFGINRYIWCWAIYFVKAYFCLSRLRSLFRPSSFIFLVNRSLWAIWTSIWESRRSFPFSCPLSFLFTEAAFTASFSNWLMMKNWWRYWFRCRVRASRLRLTFTFISHFFVLWSCTS